MAKWASRFALGFSNSAPGYLLPVESIGFVDDIGALGFPLDLISLTQRRMLVNEMGENMTDGCGSLNRSLVRALRHRYEWNERPCAFQVRVHGGKVRHVSLLPEVLLTSPFIFQGLLIEDIVEPTKKTSETPYIEISRPSQVKIVYNRTADLDPAHRSIDILRASHLKLPCSLSAETMTNLGENGVPKEVFVELFKASLNEKITPLLDWDGREKLLELWVHMQRRGGVLVSRRAREKPDQARLQGWTNRDLDETEVEDEDGFTQLDFDDSSEIGRSVAWAPDPVGGSPSSLEETVISLLDSGFEPKTCPVLREKLMIAIKGYIRREVKSYHPEVPLSASGFIVPGKR